MTAVDDVERGGEHEPAEHEPAESEPAELDPAESDPAGLDPTEPMMMHGVRVLPPTPRPTRTEPERTEPEPTETQTETRTGTTPTEPGEGTAQDVVTPATPRLAERRQSVPRVLGVHVTGGAVHLAVVDAPDRVRLDLAEVIVPASDLELGARLTEFMAQLGAVLDDLRVTAVALARPVRYSGWRYHDALARASLEACVVIEAHQRSIRADSVGQHHAANVVGVPLDRLDPVLGDRVGVGRAERSPERLPAMLVALAVALGEEHRAGRAS